MQLQGTTLHDGVRAVLNTVNQMLCAYFWKRCLEPEFVKDSTFHHARIGMENAAIESTLISIRAFDNFCRALRQPQFPDDLLPDNFPGLALGGGFLDDDGRTRINKQVAHLTQGSLGATTQAYQYRDFLTAALPKAKQFCDYARTAHVNPDAQLDSFVLETLEVVQHVDDHYIKAEKTAEGQRRSAP